MELSETKQTGSHIQLLPNILFLKFMQAAFETLEEKRILEGPDVGQHDRSKLIWDGLQILVVPTFCLYCLLQACLEDCSGGWHM